MMVAYITCVEEISCVYKLSVELERSNHVVEVYVGGEYMFRWTWRD